MAIRAAIHAAMVDRYCMIAYGHRAWTAERLPRFSFGCRSCQVHMLACAHCSGHSRRACQIGRLGFQLIRHNRDMKCLLTSPSPPSLWASSEAAVGKGAGEMAGAISSVGVAVGALARACGRTKCSRSHAGQCSASPVLLARGARRCQTSCSRLAAACSLGVGRMDNCCCCCRGHRGIMLVVGCINLLN